MRRADDVLDPAARAAGDARRRHVGLAAAYALASVAAGLSRRRAGDEPRAPGAADRVSAARRASASGSSAALGALARFLLDGAVAGRAGRAFPCGTLAVNLSGAFVLGVLAGAALERRRLAPRSARAARRVHDVQHVDAREPPPRRGRALRLGVAELRGQPRARPRRRLGSDASSGRAVNEDCLKLTTYFGERDRAGGGFLADALRRHLRPPRAADEPLLRGVEGFGAKHHLHTDRLLTLSEDLPVVSVAVDTRRAHRGGARRGRSAALRRAGHARARPHAHRPRRRRRAARGRRGDQAHRLRRSPGARGRQAGPQGRRRRCCTATGSQARRCCSASTAPPTASAGARVLRPQRARAADGHRGRRRRAHRRARCPSSARMLAAPLMTLERVRVCKRDGGALAGRAVCPSTDPRPGVWQKLMVYAASSRATRGAPLYPELVRALRGRAPRARRAARDLGLPRRPRAPRRLASGSCAAASRSSRSSSTRPSASRAGLRSSTSSRTRPVSSPARWSRPAAPPVRGIARGGLRLADPGVR